MEQQQVKALLAMQAPSSDVLLPVWKPLAGKAAGGLGF